MNAQILYRHFTFFCSSKVYVICIKSIDKRVEHDNLRSTSNSSFPALLIKRETNFSQFGIWRKGSRGVRRRTARNRGLLSASMENAKSFIIKCEKVNLIEKLSGIHVCFSSRTANLLPLDLFSQSRAHMGRCTVQVGAWAKSEKSP